MKRSLFAIVGLSLVLAASAPATAFADGEDCSTTPPAVNQIKQYPMGQRVPACQLPLHFTPQQLGGNVFQGAADLNMRVDYQNGNVTAGVFEVNATQLPLKAYVVWPFREHATIITGHVWITDDSGVRRSYGPGDSYFMQLGANVLWEQDTAVVQKSFLDVGY